MTRGPVAVLNPNLGTALVGVGCIVVAALVAGGDAAASAALAVGVVVAYFASGPLVLRIAGAAEAATGAGIFLLLLTYALRLALVLLVLGLVSGVDGLVPRALGVTLLMCALVWPALQLVRVLRTPTPMVSPPVRPGPQPSLTARHRP